MAGVSLSWEGGSRTLSDGALIGRLARADLRLADPAVSVAHALVVAREGSWWMLALRGELSSPPGSEPRDRVRLEKGVRVQLGAGPIIKVEGSPPPASWVLTDGAERWPIYGDAMRLGADEGQLAWTATDELERDDEAVRCVVWRDALGWKVGRYSSGWSPVRPGESFEAGGRRWTLEEDDLGWTQRGRRLVVAKNSVRVEQEGSAIDFKTLLQVRLLSTLVRAAFQTDEQWVSQRDLFGFVFVGEAPENGWDKDNPWEDDRRRLENLIQRVRRDSTAKGVPLTIVAEWGKVKLVTGPADQLLDGQLSQRPLGEIAAGQAE